MAQTTDARSLMERARDGAFNKLDAQRERAATGLGSMVEALRESGRQLQGQNATMASYVDGAASHLERFSGGMKERDLQQMVRDVERFARQRPAIFIGSAFALGLAMARFLKSSDSDTFQSSRGPEYSTRAYRPSWPTESVAGGMGTTTPTPSPTRVTSATATSGRSDWGTTTGTSDIRR